MRIFTTDPLFAWERLPDTSGPDRPALPAGPFAGPVAAGRPAAHRGKGRNDYPVHVLWRVHVTRYLLRHPTMEACLAELGRNPALRRAVGIESGQAVPEPWNMSRFLEVLGQPEHLELMERMFEQLAKPGAVGAGHGPACSGGLGRPVGAGRRPGGRFPAAAVRRQEGIQGRAG